MILQRAVTTGAALPGPLHHLFCRLQYSAYPGPNTPTGQAGGGPSVCSVLCGIPGNGIIMVSGLHNIFSHGFECKVHSLVY
jgi:hypothetical protein